MTESEQIPNRGFVCACRLDGTGDGSPLDWPDIETGPKFDGVTWLHLDLPDPYTADFVRNRSGLDEPAVDALLAEHTRPRLVPFDDAVVVILRGINFNPGAEPDDLVSIRIWASEHLVISAGKGDSSTAALKFKQHPLRAWARLSPDVGAGGCWPQRYSLDIQKPIRYRMFRHSLSEPPPRWTANEAPKHLF